jgi:4a-hydroxytetrahydrobiopterin dehydratase
MPNLANKRCVPCEDKNMKPLAGEELGNYLIDVPKWLLNADAKKISREFKFKNFLEAVDFISGPIADIAEAEGHHPDIHIFYNKVDLDLWTHSIGGLSENDFIVAAKIDAIFP